MRKHYLLALLMAVFTTTSLYAQSNYTMVVEQVDGNKLYFSNSNIKQVYFQEDESVVPIETNGLLPKSLIDNCKAEYIPQGFRVLSEGEYRVAGQRYEKGPRVMEFEAGGDFTHALYFRHTENRGFVEYGCLEGYELSLTQGKKYTVSFNTAAWKERGENIRFEIVDPSGKNMRFVNPYTYEESDSYIISTTCNVNGSNGVVAGSCAYSYQFVAQSTGNYVLRWTPCNASGNEQQWQECLLANVQVVCDDDVPSQSPYIGKWNIVHSKYEVLYNNVVRDKGETDFTPPYNTVTFDENTILVNNTATGLSHNTFTGTYHMEGTILVYDSGDFDNLEIVSYDGQNTLVAYCEISEMKGNYKYTERTRVTLQRTSGNTPSGTFQGPQRVFGNNRVKAVGREGYEREEFTYDETTGFVKKVHYIKYVSDADGDATEGDFLLDYSSDGITVTAWQNDKIVGSFHVIIGESGFCEKGGDDNEVTTFTYDENGQMIGKTYSYKERQSDRWHTEEIQFTWRDGDIVQQKVYVGNNNDNVYTTDITYTSPNTEAIENIAGAMEFDDGMNIDLGFIGGSLGYYLGFCGKGTKHLPQAWVETNPTLPNTVHNTKNTWTLDNAGRAVKLVNETTRDEKTRTRTYYVEWY